MRKLLMLILLIPMASCSQRQVDMDKLAERNGVMYEVNQQEPFTGKAILKLPNGQKLIEGNYSKGLKHGSWKEYHKNGTLLINNKFVDGKMDGLSEVYYDNGNIKSKINYKTDMRHGSYEKFFEDGSLYVKTNYDNNKRHGKYSSNHNNGNPKERSEYIHGKKIGLFESYWKNGNNRLTYTKTEDGSFTGDHITYNEDGSIQRHVFYTSADNKINKGTWKRYWSSDWKIVDTPSAYRSSVSFDDNGKPSTNVVFYYKNGNKFSEGYFSSIEPDSREGSFKWYWEDGSIKKELTYKNNILDGEAKSYFKEKNVTKTSSLQQRVFYKNGKLNGKVELYNGNGMFPSENPKIVDYKVNQMPRSWWKIEGQCVNGKYDGNFKVWWRYATNKRREPFNMPIYILHQWDNGNLTSNGYDYKAGIHNYYDKNGRKTSLQDRHKILDQVIRNGG